MLFTFQIYGDFSGYSDIAIGTAKLFDIKLMRNFNNPYFSRDIAEFWRRWHISLTTWFRDYVYIPLGGSRPEIPAHIQHPDRYKKAIIIRNTFVIFLVSGIWHGANWTFLAWGAYHALLFLPLILLGENRKYTNQVAAYTDANGSEHLRILPTWYEAIQMLCTFFLVVLGWIIFRAETITQAWEYICGMMQFGTLRACYRFFLPNNLLVYPVNILIVLMLLVEWLQRNRQHGLVMGNAKWYVRYPIYGIICVLLMYFSNNTATFIYFQF